MDLLACAGERASKALHYFNLVKASPLHRLRALYTLRGSYHKSPSSYSRAANGLPLFNLRGKDFDDVTWPGATVGSPYLM